MNKEYLNNYARDELSRQKQHYEKIRADNIEDAEGYPDGLGFPKLAILLYCVIRPPTGNMVKKFGRRFLLQGH